MEVRKAIRSGQLCPSHFNYKHEEWCQNMKKRDVWVDHSWLEMAAQYLNKDIVIIPLHTQASGEIYHLISAGLLSGQGRYTPIFIGNYLQRDLKHPPGCSSLLYQKHGVAVPDTHNCPSNKCMH